MRFLRWVDRELTREEKTPVRAAAKAFFIVSAFFGGCAGSCRGVGCASSSVVQQYVDDHLSEAVAAQEKFWGVDVENPLVVVGSLPEGWSYNFFRQFLGCYDNKTIYLPLTTPLTVPDHTWLNVAANVVSSGSTASVREILDHELTHYVIDIADNQKISPWSENVSPLSKRFVHEGVAEVVSRLMNNQPVYDDGWRPDSLIALRLMGFDDDYSFPTSICYPIINRFRLRGLQYLMAHPPSNDDLLRLDYYQKNVLQVLATEQK